MTDRTGAIILTHNRHELLRSCVAAIVPQVDVSLVIDNASSPPVPLTLFDGIVEGGHVGMLTHVPDQPPNLSALWADGMKAMRQHGVRYCAFLCDDTEPPAGWFEAVTDAMRDLGAAGGCTSAFGYTDGRMLKTAPDGDLMHRMVGWAFVIDLQSPVEPDLSLRWWWTDTDMDWQARAAGGMVNLGAGPGFVVPNHRPGEYTATIPELYQQSGDDGVTFERKYGGRPW